MFHRKIFDFLLNVISMETFASIIIADPFIKHVEYDFPVAQTVKNLPVMQENWVLSLGSIPGLGNSSGEGNGNPLQYSCLENSMDRGA